MDYRRKFQLEYTRLNEKQKEAVDEIEGPVMVLAGPGTGKTQILAMRIANILRVGQVNPSNILALTFTNSGVYQMKKRLLEIIGPESYNVHVHTFHSFCNEVINTYPEKFILAKELNQLTDLEQVLLIQKILSNGDYENLKPLKSPFYYDKTIIKAIGDLKQEGISPDDFTKVLKEQEDLEDATRRKNIELVDIYLKYQNALQKTGHYDYADMILFTLDAFREDPEILSFYQEKFQYVLVDEYQDTNSAQNEIVKILGSFYENPNIFVVGDDEQSIFRFQGASVENVLFFSKNYPKAKMIVLKENYRSTQKILDASRSVISHNHDQIFSRLKISKKLQSANLKLKGDISLGEFSSGEVENFFVAKEIQKLIKVSVRPSEIAVLYKEHKDAEELTAYLAKLNVPYHIEAGNNILEDVEINKLIKIFQAIENLNDDLCLLEIMHYSFFKIPLIDTYKIANAAGVKKTHIFDLIASGKLAELKITKGKQINKFMELILSCRAFTKNQTFAATFDFVINETGYLNYLLKLKDAPHHLNRLQSLFSEIKIINAKNKSLDIKSFLEHLGALRENRIMIKEKPIAANFEGVRLMTAHKAKGLEFKNVFIVHLTDKHWGNAIKRNLIKLPANLIRHQIKIKDAEEAEERRLFYVALTRAKKNIYLTYATSYGEGESQYSVPSKFIGEIPELNFKKIKAETFESQFDERLRLSFAEKKWTHSETLKEFLDDLIEKFTLSATSLNSYLDCPYNFFLNQLLRVPKVKDFNQSYGTAVHSALESFFKSYQKKLILPDKSFLIKSFKESLDEEILTETDHRRALKQGSAVLEKYYEFYKTEWKKGSPLSCEYNFKYHNVRYGKIPISGIIDKIETLDGTNVKIVDYKTSSAKSLNQLLGKTKENRLAEFYQAYFYKLLADCDPLFRWKIISVEFDFVSPKNNKFYKTRLEIDEKEYQNFKELIEKTYRRILEHRFEKNRKACKNYNRKCEYFELCG